MERVQSGASVRAAGAIHAAGISRVVAAAVVAAEGVGGG